MVIRLNDEPDDLLVEFDYGGVIEDRSDKCVQHTFSQNCFFVLEQTLILLVAHPESLNCVFEIRYSRLTDVLGVSLVCS